METGQRGARKYKYNKTKKSTLETEKRYEGKNGAVWYKNSCANCMQ